MDDTLKTELLALTHRLADAARVESLRYFRSSGLATENKLDGGFDPVTAADRAAEQAMRAILQSERPEDGILGEEFGTTESVSGLTWVLDPIDGTRAYISGTPTWGTLIGLHDGTPVVMGLIDQPSIGERFIGGLGTAQFDGPSGARDLGVKDTQTLTDATIFTTFPEVGRPFGRGRGSRRHRHQLARRPGGPRGPSHRRRHPGAARRRIKVVATPCLSC